MRDFLSTAYEHQSEITDIVSEEIQARKLKGRETHLPDALGKNVHPIAGRLHPTVIYRIDSDPNDSAYRRHQSLKHGDETYQQKIPVFADIFDESKRIVVEIDRWASEDSRDLSSYGISQLIELIGLDAFKHRFKERSSFPVGFFGNYFFDYQDADAAIRLANFAARRDQYPDFQYWFNGDRILQTTNGSELEVATL